MKKSFLSILGLGLIATTTLFLVRSIAPELEITSEIVRAAPSRGTPGDKEATTSLAPKKGTQPNQGERVEEMVSPTEDPTTEGETPDATGATFTEASSIGERLKKLPETTILDSSIVKDEYGDELLQRRSYLLETSLKYPYVEVIEWGQFDEQGNPVEIETTAQVASHVIVEKREGVPYELFAFELKKRGFATTQSIDEKTFVVQIPGEISLGKCEEAINELSSLEKVTANVEPDFLVSIGKVPTDDRFFNLWGLHNSGQTGGRNDVDVDAPEAWDRGTGSRKVLVAVIDTGIDRGHQDLQANMWTNPGEVPNNGRDDDGNGYVDDVHGWDFHNDDNNPHDDNSHGTHCAGTIGASGNNRLGVVGVNWEVSLVGIKFLGGSGFGYNSDAIKSINYATSIKAKLTSNSWGGGGYSSTMKRAIDTAGSQGIAFIAAAGNHSGNNDRSPSYPASFDSANVIAVGAHEHNGRIASFSCYGKNSVDLFAPGVNILSTTPNNGYSSFSGTSMACPHVAGAYALISSIEPTWGMSQIKQALLDNVDPETGLKEKCVSGGRLNVFHSLSSEPAKKKLISVSPTNLDFGKVRLGESKTLELIISNPGTEETTITTTAVAKEITRPENLIGHWTFDEGSGTTAANTGTKGNTYKATLISGASFSTKEKKLGTGSLHIPANQSRAYARIGNPLKLGNGSYRGETFTISAWFKKLYPNQFWRTLCKGSSYGHHLIVGYRNDSVGVYANSNGDWRDSGEFDMPAKNFQGDWNHIVAVSNKATNRTQFYLNGAYKGDSDRATGNNIYAIGNFHSGNQRFAEYLDDFRVYDVALSVEEVKSIFNEEKSDSPFRFSLQTPVKLAPGKGVKATVTFSGEGKGKREGNLLIVSDATNNPALNVPLTAEVTATPDLAINPKSIHFGLNQDEIEEKPLTLSNVGDADLTYEIIVSENADGPTYSTGLRAMGYNSYGQLGDGTRTHRSKPVQVEEKGIKAVAAGIYHSLFLKEDGSLWAMGRNSYGQLGDGTTTHRSRPVRIEVEGVQEVAAGRYHSIYLKEDGSLWAMGRNYYGQLGDGTRSTRTKPIQIESKGVKTVVTGGHHTMFIKNDGSLWGMGYNTNGQVGDGTGRHIYKPVQVEPREVKAIAAGEQHSIFLKDDGSLWAMGRNSYGQLGDGTRNKRLKPVQIETKKVIAIAGGDSHSLFLKEDGSLWAMGRNANGQLGDGTTTQRLEPVQIQSGEVSAVTAGGFHSLFLKENGSLWSMGNNGYGQLGDGTRTNRSKPVQVESRGVTMVNAGWGHSLFLKADGSPKTPEWLTIGQGKGKVSAGKQARIQVRANAGKISEPYVTAYLHIRSNDHEEPKRKIKVTVERLSNDGGLTFRPYSLTFDETYLGQTAEKTLEITNSRTEAITIKNFSFRNSIFSHRLSLPITLGAGGKISSSVYFTPEAAGTIVSSAFVLTSENGGRARSYKVSGIGAVAPSMALSPASFSETLGMNEQRQVAMKIENRGGSILAWTLKGATAMGGKTFSLGRVFNQEHFAAMAKGARDERKGAPISKLGGGPDYHGYSWSDSNDPAGPDHQWKDVSKTGKLLTELSNNKDDGFVKVALPFSVEFYGKEYKEAFVNANGYLTFGKGAEDHGHFPLPTTMMPGNLVAPFAMDLNLARGGNVYVQSAGNEFVVQYDKVKDFAGLGEYTFQISLNRNGVIHFHYDKMDGPTNRATTGIQNASADVGLLVAYNNEQIRSGMSVRISTSPKWLHASGTSGLVEGGKSVIVPITFKAGNIRAGKYSAVIEVLGNDPKNPSIEVPVSLTIREKRSLIASPARVDFSDVEVGVSGKKTFVLKNTGNNVVRLSKIATSSTIYWAKCDQRFINPGEEAKVEVEFRPTEGKSYPATCTVSSNAEKTISVALSGKGVATPIAKLKPESVKLTVAAGQKTNAKLVLFNEGKANLSYKWVNTRSGSLMASGMAANALVAGEDSPDESPRLKNQDPFAEEHVPGKLIVAFRNGKSSLSNPGKLAADVVVEKKLAQAKVPGAAGAALSELSIALVRNNGKMSLRELADKLMQDPAVAYAEPDYVLRTSDTPNDPDLKRQWALTKINASGAWKVTKGSRSVTVAVIDTGIDYRHPDLQGNVWTNPGEIPGNGKDDDKNGFVDDVYGWDFSGDDNDPMDGHRHGTHVAGTIAAATNNGKQVAGVAWHAKVAAIKFLSDGGRGSTSDAIDSIAYATAMGFPVSNNSWGGAGYSRALEETIKKAGEAGQLFCAAAGNHRGNNDSRPFYPASYSCSNIISVAASDQNDKLASFSCYGKRTVDLAAPGVNIHNLINNGRTGSMSGTSMATPHVAGAAALVLSQNPSAGPGTIKKRIMDSTDPIDALKDRMVTSGRLNLAKAVEGFAPGWLTVAPKSGSVRPGQQNDLVFTIDATDLVAGKKQAVVAFSTNDPRAKTLEVPVEVTITGDPKIKLDKKDVAFGEVWIGNEAKQKITITNSGTGRLEITRVNSGRRELSVTPVKLSLAPGEKGSLDLSLRPTSSGRISTTLTIDSNAKDEPKVTVTVTADAKQPPVMEVQPESLTYTLEPDKTGKKEIKILNWGEGTLAYSGTIVSTSRDRAKSRSMDQVVKSLNDPGRTPENSTPGVPMIDDVLEKNDSNSLAAVRKTANNPVSNLEIAILGADRSNYLQDVGKGLIESKRFSGVTMINVKSVTPTPKELEAFDSVIVYSNYRYNNQEKLGENLADFADAGGGVVCMTFETATRLGNDFVLGGRWLKEKYGVFELSKNDTRDWSSLGEILLPHHPVLQGFESFRGTYRLNKEKISAGSTLLAKWKDGFPLAAFRTEPAAVVGLNFFPASNRALSKGWDEKTDGWKIMANALEWTATGGSPDWLTATPLAGSVSGGKQKEITLSFNSAKLTEGNYTAEIRLTGNDPKKPYVPVKVTLSVQENQAPEANPTQVTLPEDSTRQIRLSGKDADGDTITFTLLDKPKHGHLSGNPPLLTYEPKANFFGRDSFTFKVSDGRQDSKPATVTLFVSPVDDKPWIKPVDLKVSEDTPIEVPFAYGDPDGDHLQVVVTRDPANGFLWKEGKIWTYFPDPHFNGKDSITYKVHDGNGTESPEAKVSIEIKPTNDAPVASNLQVSVKENSSVVFELNATDVDGDEITSYDLISPPAHGELEKPHNKQWIYSPFKGYNGEDLLVYRASDGKLQGNLATVRFTINPKNDPPVVEPATFALMEDGKLSIKLITSDPDGDSLTFKIAKAPTFGKLEGKGPTYQYAPERDFNGTDFFIVVPNDGKLDGNATRITLKVNGVNDAPRFESMSGILGNNYRETPLYLPLRATDVDGDKLVFKMAANPKNGECRLQDDQLVYFPDIGFTGKDEFEVEVSDGYLTDKTLFPITIGEHPNAIPVHLEESETNELENAFKRLIYELNARLSRSEDFMLKLESEVTTEPSDKSPASTEETLADKNGRFLKVNLTADAPKVESLTLDDWIASLKEPNKGHRFTFHAETVGNNEKWRVAPFLDPASSVDTEVISEGSYGDGEEEEEDDNSQENEDGEETLPFEESFNTLGELVDENRIPNAQSHKGAQGWYRIDSLGDFYDAGNGWIYQPDLGWCYAVVITEDSSWWLFNENTGWVWCRPDLKNTVFATGTLGKGWIFFPGASLSETETFYSYSTQEWFLWKR